MSPHLDIDLKPFLDKNVSKDTGRGKKIFSKKYWLGFLYFKALSTSVIINDNDIP